MQIHKYFNVFQIPCISNTPQHCIMLFHVYNSSSVCACVMLFPVFYSNSVCHAFPCILQQQCECHAFHVFYSSSVCAVSYTHLRAHETPEHLVCRLLLEKKNQLCNGFDL